MTGEHPYYKYNSETSAFVRSFSTFELFAASFEQVHKTYKNFHFRPQVDYLFDKDSKPICHYVGSIEAFHNDLIKLYASLDLPGEWPSPDELQDNNNQDMVIPVKNKSGSLSDTIHAYRKHPKAVAIVRNRYLADFIALGYSQDPERIEDEPSVESRRLIVKP